MGNLYGGAFDTVGAPGPGIEITITAPGQPARVQVTDAKGLYRFLDLTPGDYRLQAKTLDGSVQTVERVVITSGRNTVMSDLLLFQDVTEYLRCVESHCCGEAAEGCSVGSCIPVLAVKSEKSSR